MIEGRYRDRLLRAATIPFVIDAVPPDPAGTFMFRFRNFFALAASSAVGTRLSFSIRRVSLGVDDFANLESDGLDPGLRLLFITALTTVVGLLFWTKAVTVGMGDFQSNFQLSGTHAALIGALCGIAERTMATAVGRRPEDFAAGIGGQSRANV